MMDANTTRNPKVREFIQAIETLTKPPLPLDEVATEILALNGPGWAVRRSTAQSANTRKGVAQDQPDPCAHHRREPAGDKAMSTAELVRAVEANGGQFLVDGEELVIRPADAAIPLLEQLRANKAAIIALLQGTTARPEHEADELELWLRDRCVFHDRSWTPVAVLHLDRFRWRAGRGLPVALQGLAFVDALRAQGVTVTTDGLCGGLLLKEDWKRHEAFQAAPEPSKPPARVTRAKRRWSW